MSKAAVGVGVPWGLAVTANFSGHPPSLPPRGKVAPQGRMRAECAIATRSRLASGKLPPHPPSGGASGTFPQGGRHPTASPHSILILTFPHQRGQHAKNQAGRYAAGRRRQAAGERTGQTALVHGVLHALCQ